MLINTAFFRKFGRYLYYFSWVQFYSKTRDINYHCNWNFYVADDYIFFAFVPTRKKYNLFRWMVYYTGTFSNICHLLSDPRHNKYKFDTLEIFLNSSPKGFLICFFNISSWDKYYEYSELCVLLRRKLNISTNFFTLRKIRLEDFLYLCFIIDCIPRSVSLFTS